MSNSRLIRMCCNPSSLSLPRTTPSSSIFNNVYSLSKTITTKKVNKIKSTEIIEVNITIKIIIMVPIENQMTVLTIPATTIKTISEIIIVSINTPINRSPKIKNNVLTQVKQNGK